MSCGLKWQDSILQEIVPALPEEKIPCRKCLKRYNEKSKYLNIFGYQPLYLLCQLGI